MTLRTKIGAALLALAATAAPALAGDEQVYAANTGWVPATIKRVVVKPAGFIEPEMVEYRFSPIKSPAQYSVSDTIAEARFKEPYYFDFCGASLTYGGVHFSPEGKAEFYLLMLNCMNAPGYNGGLVTSTPISLPADGRSILPLLCPALPNVSEQPRQKILVAPLSFDKETGAMTLDVKITAINLENPR